MNKFMIAMAFTIAALLAGAVYELHGLNRRLDARSSDATAPIREVVATPGRPESPAEWQRRVDSKAREIEADTRFWNEVLKRSLAADADR